VVRVLYFSEIQWLSQVSRKHLIVRRFPGDWEVLFLSPFNLKGDENSFRTCRDAAHPAVRYRSLPLPKPDSRSAFLRSLTPALSVAGRRLLRAAAAGFAPDVVVSSNIWTAPAVSDLRKRGVPVVYDLNDLHTEFYPACRARAEAAFRDLIARASEVVSSSQHLRVVAGRGVVIGNGVDLETFAGRRDLPLPDPIARSALRSCDDLVVYVGSVDDRIDTAIVERLLETLAAGRRRVGLVLVGRVFDSALAWKRDLERRHAERVLFTGRVPYERLPEYLAHASVGIAPFVRNARTEAINPNKLYMYAAMDENVVSTPFSAEIEEHRDVVYVASTPEDFAGAVLAAIEDEGRRRIIRARIAVPNGWDEKAAQFVRLLRTLAP
jgi:teichuronic acid biosynthesis glycosyltransferase TuaH